VRQGKSPANESVPAAIGFRVHSGWAALVAVTGPFKSLTVIDRRHITLADPSIKGSVQPYHAAEPTPFADAERLIQRCIDSSRGLAFLELRKALDDLRKKGYRVTACGLLLASGRPLPDLAATLASHALIHTAEGELFRDAVIYAGERCELPVLKLKERGFLDHAAARFGISATALPHRLTELGRTLGTPWRQDEKYTALVAALALADS
jgi:hypothetical protein